MNFATVKSIKIPEGVVKTLSINGQVVWKKKSAWPITYTEPFHFITKDANKVRLVRQPESKTYAVLEYSTDNVNWNPWGSTESGTLEMSMEPNSKLYLRGNNTHFGEDYMWFGANRFESDGPIDSAGDISSLVDVNNMQPNTFAGLFHQFKNLKSAPRLNLPVLPNSCYSNTFRASGIKSVDLSLIHVAEERGIGETFIDCTDLVDIKYPTDLTVGKWGTFFGTFQNSGITTPFDFNFSGEGSETYYRTWSNTKIKSVKINVKHWDEARYTECFQGSKELSLIDFSSVDTASVVERNWVLDVAPKGIFVKKESVDLPTGPHGIPEGWTVMTPEEYAEYKKKQHQFRFVNASNSSNTLKLEKLHESAPTLSLERSSNGVDFTPVDLYKGITLQKDETVYLRGNNASTTTVSDAGIAANKFTSTGLIEAHGNLNDITSGSLELKPYHFAFLFNGMENLTTAPDLPSVNLSECAYQMCFSACSNLVEGPKIYAQNLGKWSCNGMFMNCSKLKTIEMVIDHWDKPDDDFGAMIAWLNNVQSHGNLIAPNLTFADIPENDNGLPKPWTLNGHSRY